MIIFMPIKLPDLQKKKNKNKNIELYVGKLHYLCAKIITYKVQKKNYLKIIEIYLLSDISQKLVFMYSYLGSFTRL
jgi:hypothetical protein